jgi:mannose-6-phosphate isomerase
MRVEDMPKFDEVLHGLKFGTKLLFFAMRFGFNLIFATKFLKTMQSVLYPLKFKPIFKDKIWGGRKIKEVLGMDYGPLPNCGEVWLLSGIWDEQSEVANGDFEGDEINDLVETFMGDLVGESVFDKYGEQFPLLLKIIDANDWLSVQVHPDDELAEKRGLGNGKTEMWYVMQADQDAELVMGFNREITRMDYANILKNNTLQSVLNHEQARKDDVFFIPAGRVHALGPGIMVAEIQQTSDTTYRIYDWDRIDVAGMRRELHIPQSVEAIDGTMPENFKTEVPDVMNKTVSVVDCQYFVTNLLQLQGEMEKDYSNLDSFVILMPLEGFFSLHWENGAVFVKAGECVLVPNLIKKVSIRAEQYCKLLEVYCQLEENDF